MSSCKSNIRIYSTGALFNCRELICNISLNEILESKYGYECFVPQRDGFEDQFQFIKSILKQQYEKANQKELTEDELTTCLQYLIYLVDMCYFITKSDVVLGHLDEPMDEGVVVELAWGRTVGKAVIGWRTDIRPVFGSLSHSFKGIHWFVSNQCDKYIYHSFHNITDTNQANSHLHTVAQLIHKAIQQCLLEGKISDSTPRTLNPVSPIQQQWIQQGQFVFQNIQDIHSQQNLIVIVQRLLKLKEDNLLCLPTILQ